MTHEGNKFGWKGGKIKCNGYWYIYSPNHPYKNKMGSGYVKQSRLIMEKKIGRYLTRQEFVHHINGLRDDDREENLIVISHKKHQSHHQKETVKMMERDKNGKFLRKGVRICRKAQSK